MLHLLAGCSILLGVRKAVPLVVALQLIKLSARRKRRHAKSEASAMTAKNAKSSIHLEWHDVTLTVKKRKVLSGVSGEAKPGRLLAILGPSGGGKTSLLNAIAQATRADKGVSLSGSLSVNGQLVQGPVPNTAYIEQSEAFFSMLTTRETLNDACAVRRPELSSAQREELISSIVSTLGLGSCLETRVGDSKRRGLSGGERKRLSIAIELLGDPQCIMADEPTSGLDAFSAQQVVGALKSLTSPTSSQGSGKTVVAVIHQPRSSIWQMLDDVCLISQGHVIFIGPREEAIPYFESQGHALPPGYSPSDFILDLISIDESTPENEERSRARLEKLMDAWKLKSASSRLPTHQPYPIAQEEHKVPVGQGDALMEGGNLAPRNNKALGRRIVSALGSSMRRFSFLLVRSWRQVMRDKATNIARIMANASSALIFGLLFHRLDIASVSATQDRLGLLQVAAINAAMSSLVKTLQIFTKERAIIQRERLACRPNEKYSIASYLSAKLIAELPTSILFPFIFGSVVYPLCGLSFKPKMKLVKFLGILTLESFTSSALGMVVGSFAPTPEAATALGPAVMVVFIVMGGLYLNESSVPLILRWLPKVSLIKQAFQALVINEFTGLEGLEAKSALRPKTGSEVLAALSFDSTSITECLIIQAAVLGCFWLITEAILDSKKEQKLTLN